MEVRTSDLDHLDWLSLSNEIHFKDEAVLDLGCGSGYICINALEKGAKKAMGVDIIKPDNAGVGRWEFNTLDLDSPRWDESFENEFSLITAFDIIEHLSSPWCNSW